MIVYNQDINVVLRWIIKVSLGHHVDAPIGIDEQPLPPPFNPKEIDIVIAGFPWQVLLAAFLDPSVGNNVPLANLTLH